MARTFLRTKSLTPSLPGRHGGKTTNKRAKFETLQPFCLLFPTAIFIKMLSTQSRCVIGQGNILFAGFFQPLNFVGRGSERATFCRVLCAPVPLPPPPPPPPPLLIFFYVLSHMILMSACANKCVVPNIQLDQRSEFV